MSTSAFRATSEFQRGRNGERLVADYLQRAGWYVIASYDFSGEDGEKAPRLLGWTDSAVLPDLDISKAGSRMWVEVKTKAAANWTRITNRFEHGIPLRHYLDYLRVERETGCPVWLAIHEEDTDALLIQRLQRLSKRESNSGVMGPMVFFARDDFKELAAKES